MLNPRDSIHVSLFATKTCGWMLEWLKRYPARYAHGTGKKAPFEDPARHGQVKSG